MSLCYCIRPVIVLTIRLPLQSFQTNPFTLMNDQLLHAFNMHNKHDAQSLTYFNEENSIKSFLILSVSYFKCQTQIVINSLNC